MSLAKQDDVSKTKKGRLKKLHNQVPLPGPWRNSSWVTSFGGKGASPLKYNDVSPSFILRQLLLLIEKKKFTDTSQLVNKIPIEGLKDIVMDIPMEKIIECIPQSLVLLESLYSRLFISDAENFPVEQFQVEVMAFHVVRYLSMLESSVEYKYPKPEDAKKSILNILRIVLNVNPDLVRTLYKRKKIMDTALQGIGEHGLIEVRGSLITLHDALKLEIGRNVTAYKSAVNTLEHLHLSKNKPISLKITGDKKSGQGQNHQALTKLNENQVKSRLFKNKALLNAIESHINTQLPALSAMLKDRIEYDKSALLAFGKLKSEIKTFSSQTKVVPLLAQYSKSLHSVLDMFKDLLDEHCGSDKSSNSTLGYHSDEGDMLSVQEASNDLASQETVVQSETEGSPTKEVPSTDSVEQILNSPVDESSHDKLSLPGDDPSEKRSRWWKHHRRSHSLDVSRSSRSGVSGNQQSVVISEPVGRPSSRASSVDRSSISRPRRESVEESQEFQTMMVRIRELSGSSPAVGRRQLERRGLSTPRSRDSSISPAALRRHFFGGGSTGELTPSISSQTESKDDQEVLYATIKPKGQRSPTSDKEILKAGPSQAQKLEDALRERDRLAEREKKLKRENEQLKETLRFVTMEMELMKDGRAESANEEVFSPGPAQEDPIVPTRRTSKSKEEPSLQSSAKESSNPVNSSSSISDHVLTASSELIPAPLQFLTPEPIVSPLLTFLGAAVSPESPTSPPKIPTSPSEPVSPLLSDKENALSPISKLTASFVEKQKSVLREQAGSVRQCHSKTQVPLDELPVSSVKQQKASFELKLKESHPEASSLQVKWPSNPNLKHDQPGPVKLEVTEPELAEVEPQVLSVELQKESEQPKIADEESKDVPEPEAEAAKPGQAKPEPEAAKPGQAKPEPQVSSDEDQKGSQQAKPAEQSQDLAVQEKSFNNDQESSPTSQDQMPPAASSQPDNKPPEEQVEKQETLTEQKPPVDTQESEPSTDIKEKANPVPKTNYHPKSTSPRKVKSATFAAQLHLRPIMESPSPATQPKASSLKEAPDIPHRLSKNGEVKKNYIHSNRHLPKNMIRHMTGDLLYDYDKLYSEQRAVAWTCLTIPPEDKDLLLFSVIVFAFQSAQTTIHELHMAKSRMLLIPATDDEESVSSYTMDIPPDNRSQVELLEHLRKMGVGFDLNPMIMDVMEQLFEITEHTHLIQTSVALKKFVTSCVSLAWRLSIQSAPYVIDFELRSFDSALHQRVPGSNRKSARVKEHIWPALLESTKGMCIYKGVVLT